MSDLVKKTKFPPYPPCVDVPELPVSNADTQPPQINSLSQPGPLRQYLKSLRERSDQQRLFHERVKVLEQQIRELEAKSKMFQEEPIELQIKRWWLNLPPSMRERHFQITEIAGHCRSRSRGRPALREVAAALRSLGWVENRDWTNSGRNRRYWKAVHQTAL